MSFPAARLTDMHVCPLVTVLVPHVGGPIVGPGAPTVLVGVLPAARVGDMLVCVGPPDVIAVGAFTVLISGQPAARMLDSCAHGGMIVAGLPTVLIGSAAGGGGGGGGGGGAAGPAAAGESLWDQICDVVEVVVDAVLGREHYSDNIIIDGPPEFRAKTRAALDELNATPTGRALLDKLNAGDHTVTIVPTQGTDGNSCSYTTAGMVRPDGSNGPGSDSTVAFNPDRTTIGSDPWATRPPAIGLGHELVHASHAGEGSIDNTPAVNDARPDPSQPDGRARAPTEEVRTAGIPPSNTDPLNENAIRSEWPTPLPQRGWY